MNWVLTYRSMSGDQPCYLRDYRGSSQGSMTAEIDKAEKFVRLIDAQEMMRRLNFLMGWRFEVESCPADMIDTTRRIHGDPVLDGLEFEPPFTINGRDGRQVALAPSDLAPAQEIESAYHMAQEAARDACNAAAAAFGTDEDDEPQLYATRTIWGTVLINGEGE